MSERNFRVNSPKHNRIHSSNNPPPKKDSEKNPSGPLRDKIANVRKESEQEWKDRIESLTTEVFGEIEKRILEEAKNLKRTSYIFDYDAVNELHEDSAIWRLYEDYVALEMEMVNGMGISRDMIIKELRAKLKDSGLKVSCKWNKGTGGKMLEEMKISWD